MYNKYGPYNVMQMADIIYGPLWRDHPIIVSITSIFAIYINLRFVSSKMVDVLCIQLCMHTEHDEHNCVLQIHYDRRLIIHGAWVTFSSPQSISMIFILQKRASDRGVYLYVRALCCIDMMCVCVCAASAH